MLKGAQIALDEANGTGGVDGKRLALDQGDDKADPAAAPAVAQKLAADGVAAVVGPATSGPAVAAATTLNQAKVPMITPTANDPKITSSQPPYVLRATGRWDQEPPLLAEQLLKQPSTAKVALVADKSSYGQVLAAGMRQALSKGGALPVAEETVESGTKDFAAVVSKVKAQAAGSVFYGGYAAEGAALAKALRASGVQPTLAMGDAAEDQTLISTGGAAVEGLLLAYPPDPKQVPSAAAFLDAYKRRYGTAASLYALSTYDTVRLLADALRRGGTDAEALRKAISGTRDFNGVYWGKMSFDGSGDLQARTYTLWTVRNGKFEQVAG